MRGCRAKIIFGPHEEEVYKGRKNVRECAIEGCDTRFIPWMKTQIYCSRECQHAGWVLRTAKSRAHAKRRRPPANDLEF